MKARVSERPYLFQQVKQVSGIVSLHHVLSDMPLQHDFVFLLAEKCKGSCRADVQEQAADSRLKGAVC